MEKSLPDALVARERALIGDLEIDRPAWRFRRGNRGGTASHASFVYALSMPEAPVALAMLRAYVDAVGLDLTDQWSVSAMPSWAGATGFQRFATISSANIELFYVWFESRSGAISEWGVRVPADLGDRIPEHDELWRGEEDNGDISVHGETLSALLGLLTAPSAQDALAATYKRRQGPRRSDWHNLYLGALVGAKLQSSSSGEHDREVPTEPETPEDVEFERRYIERVTKQRMHQAPLREAALRKYGAQCMYCGLGVPQILEAAHIIPDSEGGAASTSNVRILCANHHAALDAKLIMLDGENLVRVLGAPEVLPGRRISLALPVKPDEDQTDDDDDEDDDHEDDEQFQWILTDPDELTPHRLGDTVLYDQADYSGLYAEGALLGIHFLSEDPSNPLDITYRLDIRPHDADESVTITVSGDGYVSRYIDTEDPEQW